MACSFTRKAIGLEVSHPFRVILQARFDGPIAGGMTLRFLISEAHLTPPALPTCGPECC